MPWLYRKKNLAKLPRYKVHFTPFQYLNKRISLINKKEKTQLFI